MSKLPFKLVSEIPPYRKAKKKTIYFTNGLKPMDVNKDTPFDGFNQERCTKPKFGSSD